MTKEGVAIVGLGLALPRHARALRELEDRIAVIGAWSRTADRRAAAARDFGLPVTDDLDALVRDPRVTMALVLTPPASHGELAERFLEAGKHVLVEKPLAASLEAASAMVAKADALGRRLGVVLQHRFRPAYLALLELVECGALGRIEVASCRVPWWRDQAYYDEPGRGTRARDGGGVLMTQAIHTLDLFRSLVGSVRRVAALARTTGLHRMECEDAVVAILALEGGGVACVEATTAAFPGHPEEIRLVCTNGTATLSRHVLTVDWLHGERTEVGGGEESGTGSNLTPFSHAAHRALIQDFLEAITGDGVPRASGREALATQRLMETLLEAAEQTTWLTVDDD